jgi:membrane fusion protein, adhesin transport system
MATQHDTGIAKHNGNGTSTKGFYPSSDGKPGYDELERDIPKFYTTALRLVQQPETAAPLARNVMYIIGGFILFLFVAPWQQNVVGSGIVTSFSPDARPQTIDALIDGRIDKWSVKEGAFVNKGDTIAVLRDIDTKFLDTAFAKRQKEIRDGDVAEVNAEIISSQQKVIQAQSKVLAAEAGVGNANFDLVTARTRYERAVALEPQGLISRREYETAGLSLQKGINDSVKARTSLQIENRALSAANAELEAKRQSARSKIAKADLELGNASFRRDFGIIRSPITGYVTRIMQAGPGQAVKKNDRLAIVVPTSDDIAAEIYVGSLDAAIIDTGRQVRLQFAGFPAIQAPGGGWPDFSVGTFGGTVKVVDAVDDGSGKYRVLVVPDSTQQAWPSRAYLRQGTDVTGWVLLETVPIGYEFWRQLNGFPPLFPVKASGKKSDSKDEKAKAEKK